jgi:ATP-binding cassette subfamily F protein uup
VEYAGGYSDWARRGHALAQMDAVAREAAPPPAPGVSPAASRGTERAAQQPTKLGYLEQRELNALPGRIEALEAEIAALEARIAAPDFYAQPWERTQPVLDALAEKNAAHDRLAERWLDLEERQAALAASQAR